MINLWHGEANDFGESSEEEVGHRQVDVIVHHLDEFDLLLQKLLSRVSFVAHKNQVVQVRRVSFLISLSEKKKQKIFGQKKDGNSKYQRSDMIAHMNF